MRTLRGRYKQKVKVKMASYHLTVKIGKRGTGSKHAEYIQRSGAYENYKGGEDLVHVEFGNMPCWAQHCRAEFFRQADLQERKNGSSYREFEAAIPRELSSEQHIEFVREFVGREIGEDHPYVWAIHNPIATLGGGTQPHVHVMFSERKLDGVERNPDEFFKRYNSKNPENGGCQKESKFSGGLDHEERKAALVGLRERFATLQNKYLATNGHASRVDHRSLKNQGIERQAERHLGPERCRDTSIAEVIKEFRAAGREVAQAEIEIDHHQIDITSSLTAALLERYYQNVINSTSTNRSRRIPPPHPGHCLHQVPEFILGGNEGTPREVEVLLPEAVRYNMGAWDGRQKKDRELRRVDTGNVETPPILSQATVLNSTTASISKIVVVEKRKSKTEARGWER